MRSPAVIALGALLIGLVACKKDEPPVRDTGLPLDSTGVDKSVPDQRPPDAPVPDKAVVDQAVPDAYKMVVCPKSYASCATFTDATAAGAKRTVEFATAYYRPRCMKVKVGQTVKFDGGFGGHPITQWCGPALAIVDPPATSPDMASYTFTKPGTYGYACIIHGVPKSGAGMGGAIEVVP